MKTPDITLAQILAAISAIASQAVALSVLSPGTEQYIVQIAGIVIPTIWTLVDAVIRHGRSNVAAAQAVQTAQAAVVGTTNVANAAPALTDKPAGADVPSV